jgi:hypothetical protein
MCSKCGYVNEWEWDFISDLEHRGNGSSYTNRKRFDRLKHGDADGSYWDCFNRLNGINPHPLGGDTDRKNVCFFTEISV